MKYRVVPTETGNDREVMLMVKLGGRGSLKPVYSPKTDGPTTMDPAIECWADCIAWGTFCSTPCSVCVSAPSVPTCSPCGVCIGGTATLCAGKCGIEEFW